MSKLMPLRDLPSSANYGSGDVLVIFGELFGGGYVNGLIEEAKKKGMTVIYSTVGRRDEEGLRPLNAEEIAEKNHDGEMINIPLEAGFDLSPATNGQTPSDQLKGVKLKEWKTASLDWDLVRESQTRGAENFTARCEKWAAEVAKHLPKDKKVVFAHTMAGGVPRAKIIMPAMNRVFKGFGDRFASSEEFWASDLGKLCEKSFMEVTANTFSTLIEVTSETRKEIESSGGQVSYTAYGYHGTEILIDGKYQWQSFAPYLQGYAKMALESYAEEAFSKGIKATVFNAPEILTNSSSIFAGIEIPLYTLLAALEKENTEGKLDEIISTAKSHFKEDGMSEKLSTYLNEFFTTDVIREWSDFPGWPQHNGPQQMEMIKTSSTELLDWQKDPKTPLSNFLSEVVFKACGKIMLNESHSPREPVWWIGHDAVAKSFL